MGNISEDMFPIIIIIIIKMYCLKWVSQQMSLVTCSCHSDVNQLIVKHC